MASALRLLRLTALFSMCAVTPSMAIPSPELVVGSISSLSQLAALISALFGGAAAIGFGARRSAASKHAIAFAAVATGLLFISLGLNAYQYLDAGAKERARLEATLARPSRIPGTPVIDPTLKELSYGEQLSHPLGISTAESERLLKETINGNAPDVMLVDVRESAETVVGTLTGALKLRYADLNLAKFKEQVAGKKAVLFCHNGNRSSETCAALAKLGIDCRFVVGGLEKWLVEGRQISGLQGRTLETLRAISPYPNDKRLLKTSEVKELVSEQGAYFLDVRYPGEFATGHLPGAVNITVRTTSTADLKRKIDQLPRKPIIVPCYERRSCFFGEIIGLELTQAGHDFRGRYTVPWDYYPAPVPPPHVIAWQQEQARGLWSGAVAGLSGILGHVAQAIGLVAAILMLALLSRLVILPFSLKAERDQDVMRQHADEYRKLREDLKGDPQRRARAIRAFYRRHGLTPARNLLALLFLPVLAVSVSAVHQAAVTLDGSVLWFADFADRDPLLLLPIAFGLMVGAYLHVSLARTYRQRLAVWLVAFPLFVAAAALMSAAANVYIVASMALLFVQRWVVQKPWRAFMLRRAVRADVLDLALAGHRADCGNKAFRLGKLIELGVDVPRGVVLSSAFLGRFARMQLGERASALDEIWREVGSTRVAVRSSGAGEDGAEHSFAGVFESVVNVDRAGLEAAIERVLWSFSDTRAAGYGVSSGSPNILVQTMVEAEFSGVLFTRDPLCAGNASVELVKGTAEDLVSGRVAPRAYRFGRLSGQALTPSAPDIDLSPLLAIGRRCEAAFGGSQDVEWTYAGGRFQIVQCRDITSMLDDPMETEREAALAIARGASADEVVFAQTEMTEVLPSPTPLSLSLMQAVWGPGGSVDLACRSLGLEYNVADGGRDYLVTIAGRLFVDKREELARAPRVSRLAGRRLARSAERLAESFQNEFLSRFSARMAVLEVADFKRIPTEKLMSTLREVRDSFVHDSYAHVEAINIAAGFYLQEARKVLGALGHDPATALAHMPETRASRLARAAFAPGASRFIALQAGFGHRAPYDYELSCPRYSETPELLPMVAKMWSSQTAHKEPGLELSRKAQAALDRARLFECLKEDGKHEVARELAVLRRLVLAIADRFGLREEVFYLDFQDLERMPFAAGHDLALGRVLRSKVFQTVHLPRTLTIEGLEKLAFRSPAVVPSGDGILGGVRVSGSRDVTGRALVVTTQNAADALARLQDGDILVSSIVSPDWMPHFHRLGGIVAEVGGWLSHTAILAREHGVTMLVQVDGLAAIEDGDEIEVCLDGSVRRASAHVAAECRR